MKKVIILFLSLFVYHISIYSQSMNQSREDTLKELKEFLPKPKKGVRLQDIVKLFGNEIIIIEQFRSTFFQFPL